MEERTDQKILVGISSCLLGERVRYDGGHKKNNFIIGTLGQYFEYRAFCPEMAIGMGVPRKPIRLEKNDDQIRVVGVTDRSVDVTDQLIAVAKEQSNWHAELCGYIVKKDSPSCGMERVKVYKKDCPERNGAGAYTEVMMEGFPDLPVEEEGRLGDPGLRENFIQRVFIYRRWKDLIESGVTLAKLTEFHARHKLILFSHGQDEARAIGSELGEIRKGEAQEFAPKYIARVMKHLKTVATRSNHVNTLDHIRGYLKRELDTDDKQELSESIESYRQGYLPLIVPITLLRHHFRRHPNDYIERSWYLRPHPDQLMLFNRL